LVKQGRRKVSLFSPFLNALNIIAKNKITAKNNRRKKCNFYVDPVYLQIMHSVGPEVVLEKQGVARATQVCIFI
jgi:hypothetical protein